MKCEGFYSDCERNDAVEYRMNTQYVDEERNYRIMCPICQQISEDYWDVMWADYYGNNRKRKNL